MEKDPGVSSNVQINQSEVLSGGNGKPEIQGAKFKPIKPLRKKLKIEKAMKLVTKTTKLLTAQQVLKIVCQPLGRKEHVSTKPINNHVSTDTNHPKFDDIGAPKHEVKSQDFRSLQSLWESRAKSQLENDVCGAELMVNNKCSVPINIVEGSVTEKTHQKKAPKLSYLAEDVKCVDSIADKILLEIVVGSVTDKKHKKGAPKSADLAEDVKYVDSNADSKDKVLSEIDGLSLRHKEKIQTFSGKSVKEMTLLYTKMIEKASGKVDNLFAPNKKSNTSTEDPSVNNPVGLDSKLLQTSPLSGTPASSSRRKSSSLCKVRQELANDEMSPGALTPDSPVVGSKRKRQTPRRLMSMDPQIYSLLISPNITSGELNRLTPEWASKIKSPEREVNSSSADDSVWDAADESNTDFSLSNLSAVEPVSQYADNLEISGMSVLKTQRQTGAHQRLSDISLHETPRGRKCGRISLFELSPKVLSDICSSTLNEHSLCEPAVNETSVMNSVVKYAVNDIIKGYLDVTDKSSMSSQVMEDESCEENEARVLSPIDSHEESKAQVKDSKEGMCNNNCDIDIEAQVIDKNDNDYDEQNECNETRDDGRKVDLIPEPYQDQLALSLLNIRDIEDEEESELSEINDGMEREIENKKGSERHGYFHTLDLMQLSSETEVNTRQLTETYCVSNAAQSLILLGSASVSSTDCVTVACYPRSTAVEMIQMPLTEEPAQTFGCITTGNETNYAVQSTNVMSFEGRQDEFDSNNCIDLCCDETLSPPLKTKPCDPQPTTSFDPMWSPDLSSTGKSAVVEPETGSFCGNRSNLKRPKRLYFDEELREANIYTPSQKLAKDEHFDFSYVKYSDDTVASQFDVCNDTSSIHLDFSGVIDKIREHTEQTSSYDCLVEFSKVSEGSDDSVSVDWSELSSLSSEDETLQVQTQFPSISIDRSECMYNSVASTKPLDLSKNNFPQPSQSGGSQSLVNEPSSRQHCGSYGLHSPRLSASGNFASIISVSYTATQFQQSQVYHENSNDGYVTSGNVYEKIGHEHLMTGNVNGISGYSYGKSSHATWIIHGREMCERHPDKYSQEERYGCSGSTSGLGNALLGNTSSVYKNEGDTAESHERKSESAMNESRIQAKQKRRVIDKRTTLGQGWLCDQLANVRPYVITGWLSTEYLMALVRQMDFNKDLFSNTLDQGGNIHDWVLENCNQTSPALLARDLVFRLFTLRELQQHTLNELSHRKRYQAMKMCVKRCFLDQVSGTMWKKCTEFIKASVDYLFQVNVPQVQNFLFSLHSS